MFEFYALIVGLVSTAVCSVWDLKTTEIPDWIPIATIVFALVLYAYSSYITGNFDVLLSSLIWGSLFSVIGYSLYHFGQWGGGDAELLAAMGFLTAGFNSKFLPFPLVYFFNLFLLGSAYMLLYSIVIAINNKKVIINFKKSLQNSNYEVILFLMVVLGVLSFYVTKGTETFIRLEFLVTVEVSFILLYIVWIFAKTVENIGFKKRIPIKKLKVGDVLLSNKKWIGITREELRKIKRSGKKYVWIKEGIRFAPSFFLALIASWYFGMFFF